ncbi:hypothetical protein [Aeromicrobium sp. 179-A 4D2 NHS]|uniref:hypothetical protein n=1 Tax=Aeromicrobium sp. 179-A 4D2 NHS TaxID=3142375 RepID=UPI0039A01FC9
MKQMTAAEHRHMMAVMDDVKTALVAEQQKRRENPMTWRLNEERVVLEKVNEWRAKTGLKPVMREHIETIESSANGHSDYTEKFSLYAAELAVGVHWIDERGLV